MNRFIAAVVASLAFVLLSGCSSMGSVVGTGATAQAPYTFGLEAQPQGAWPTQYWTTDD